MDSVILQPWRSVCRHRALAMLLLAKLAAVLVPLALKGIVDTFSADERKLLRQPAKPVAWCWRCRCFCCSIVRCCFASTLWTEPRGLMFARVALAMVSDFAQRTPTCWRGTFERGTRGIALPPGAGLFTVLPTLVEIAAVLVAMMAAGYSAAVLPA